MDKLGNLFILGDSYSTFSGNIPEDCHPYYPANEEVGNNVVDVSQTWWKPFIEETGANLIENCSYSGSTICHTGYRGEDYSKISFIARFEKRVASGLFDKNKIDTFILFGATNDSWANSPLGEVKYSDWTNEDLYSSFPAFCYLLDRILTVLPDTKLIFVLNSELKPEINETYTKICEKYNVDMLKLKDIQKVEGHPDIKGMKQIKEQIIEYVKSL